MDVFRRAKTLDFSLVFETLFADKTFDGPLMRRVETFLEPHWDNIREHDLHLLQINLEKKRQGHRKCDLRT